MRVKTILAIVVLVTGVCILAVSVVSIKKPGHERRSESIESALKKNSVKDLEAAAKENDLTAASAAAVGQILGLGDGISETTGLAAEVADTIAMYGSTSPDDFLRVLSQQGIEPPKIMKSNPEWAEKAWRLSRLIVAGAEIDESAIEVVVVQNGSGYVHPDPTISINVGRRDEGREFLSMYPPGSLESVDVVLPGTFLSEDGQSFEGVFVVRMTLNPEGAVWTFTEQRLIGVPAGVAVMMPPM